MRNGQSLVTVLCMYSQQVGVWILSEEPFERGLNVHTSAQGKGAARRHQFV
jgi:hypothetical protein